MKSGCRNQFLGFVLIMIGFFLTVSGEARTSLSFGFGRGGLSSRPIWVATDLRTVLLRIDRDIKSFLENLAKKGSTLAMPPMKKVPHWAQCQEIGLRNNPKMILVRMNLAGAKAALALLKGRFDSDFEDSLGRTLPFSFDAEAYGSEILHDFRLMGYSRAQKNSILSREANGLRDLFSGVRDEINRDVVWAHHALERAQMGKDQAKISLAAWELYVHLGMPSL